MIVTQFRSPDLGSHSQRGEVFRKMSKNFLMEQVKKFTGSVRTVQTQTNYSDEKSEITPLLVYELNGSLDDFVRNDPEDTIFEEFDSPFSPETPYEWKSRRPSIVKSVVVSCWTVLQLIIWGILIGTFGVVVFYVDINTADHCHWMPLNKLERGQKRIRVAGVSFQAFLVQFWQFLIVWTMFEWPLLKELNLLTVTIVSAFIAVSYHLLLHIFDADESPWIPYPLNVLFASLTLYNSYAVGRRMFPASNLEAYKLALKLCAQFLVGMPISFIFNYLAFPWFAQTTPGIGRAMIAFFAPMCTVPAKIVSRLSAIHLEGTNHPGTSHAIVATLYGAGSIVFRTLQAGIESFQLFLALSIAHGVLHIAERLTVPLRDYYWNKLALSLCCCCGCDGCHQRRQYNVRSPRSQRLTADMSIQGMLFETTATVYSIAVLYVYYLVYGVSEDRWSVFLVEVTERIPTALALEFVFNSISVLFQTRYMNIPVMRVWKRNWKKHLTLAMITTTMTVAYYTEYQLQLIRAEYREVNGSRPLMGNCTKPFH